jgi:hypothetical protein
MSKCSRCESLPASRPEVGVLYVASLRIVRNAHAGSRNRRDARAY